MIVILSSFVAGQCLILAFILIAQTITYASNLLAFCLWFAIGADTVLLGGVYIERIAQAFRIKKAEEEEKPFKVGGEIQMPKVFGKHEKHDMDEVPAIPEELEVTNVFVKRAGK